MTLIPYEPLEPWQIHVITGSFTADIPAAAVYRTEVLPQWSSASFAHVITTVRLVRDQEKAFCTCGAALPIERDGGGLGEAVSETIRQHLAEVARGAAEGRQDG